jgi:acyl carrier protein
MHTLEKVREVVGDRLKLAERDRIVVDAKLADDLSVDSLDKVEIALALETDFGINIPDDDIETWQTVGNLADWLGQNVMVS